MDFNPPLIVHVCWSDQSDNPVCAKLGQALYEFLCRPLDANVAAKSAVGIPVRVGCHAKHVAEVVKLAVEDRGLDQPCIVAVPLLDIASRSDESFCGQMDELWKAGGDKGWPRVVILPVFLDETWTVPNTILPCRSAAFVKEDSEKVERAVEEVSMGICHFLMNRAKSDQPQRVRIFISHAKRDLAGTSNLAESLRDYLDKTELESFFDVNDMERGRSVTEQLDKAQQNAVFLSLRTDDYSESPYCLDEVLTAKRHGVPIVCVHALSQNERRSLTYGGNAFTYVRRDGEDEIKAIADICLRAWLRHVYFHHAAPGIFRLRRVPLEPCYLSRAPELIDFAQGLLPRDSATLVVYPDPPLPQAEVTVIRSAYPKVRLATPTTLHRELLRRVASPALDGLRVALSLSDSPELSKIADLLPGRTQVEPRGVTDENIREVIAHLTSSLIGTGAELGYGGNLSKEGFTTLLSDQIEAFRRTTKTSRDLLFNYLALYLWDPKKAERIRARFIKVDASSSSGASAEVKQALQLAAMRKRMAEDCHARVIMGGKKFPIRSPGDKAGYSGRLPGLAEEAWAHLELNKPVYVAAGFGGCARFVADALCGNLTQLPTESAEQATNEHYREFCRGFDLEVAEQGLKMPAGLDALWGYLAEKGRGFFHGEGADDNKLWSNGLTVAENRRLFESTYPEEISTLMLLGLLRWRDETRGTDDAPLKVMLFPGSICDVPDVDSYAVMVLRGAPLRGADGALDAAIGGGIQRHLERDPDKVLVAVKGGQLAGDYVILQTIGNLAELDAGSAAQEKQWLIDRIHRGMAEMVEHARRLGLDSPALVAFGSNLGLGVRESVCAIFRGLLAARAGRGLNNVALCEVDPSRYQQIIKLKNEIESADSEAAKAADLKGLAGRIQFTELRSENKPMSVAVPRPAILLDVRRSDRGLIVQARAPGSGTAVPIENKPIDWTEIMTLTHGFGDGRPPELKRQRAIGSALAKLVLPAHAWEALAAHPETPVDVLHDVEAAAIPFELLCLSEPDDITPHWPALKGGIRRCLLTQNIPRRNRAGSGSLRLRLLLIANPTEDLPEAEEEAQTILAAFNGRADVIVQPLIGPDATCESVIDKLKTQTFEILHFAGHADFNAREPGQSGLLLAGRKKLRTQDLFDAKLDALPALVVLNACRGGRVRALAPGPAPAEQATRDASLAETIIGAGIQGFIGNLWDVQDQAAAGFSVKLYAGLAGGRSLGDAFLEARRELFNKQHRDWPNYMLYGDPDMRI